MRLFLITVKQRQAANLTIMEKGMSVEISAHMESDLRANGAALVREAFLRKYNIDLMKLGGPGAIWQYFEVKRIS